ncbi:OmpA family protein [Subsaximicrobium wynnwilliamsii]|uniref:OmpA family protein n=1 Tax=Subsaximicrobium wynnwilliamsii TaxID=291179 RepID=A0A5C6ZJV0_9FLAO|nr:OmpA family protein [Subsaximicrobium wynnwilliamsii]TXD84113.1 OmpA family protein [Subsaximicrobium wynnwilliamsii]TXD88929.1 OmpA family protein [Subsaximicrobium wynnwilliamsii]TXE03825.1 OmpA family protein [Subsaximicrobium wynnwilliamsii]
MKRITLIVAFAFLITSCVSKKKYMALEQEKGELKSELTKTRVENEELEAKFSEIQSRVDNYNSKISSLTEDNNSKLVNVDGVVISENQKKAMRETLKNVPPAYMSTAKTLKDSMNLAVKFNLQKSMDNIEEDEDIDINIQETVVMISISDKMLFNSGSYKISDKANDILSKIANVVNSEESLDIMIEGHTDNQTFVKSSAIKDNWDLSVLRATAVVKKLQNDYGVAPEKLIAAGRSFYQPLTENDSKENRSKNRRTRVVILPNIDKFFALMSQN